MSPTAPAPNPWIARWQSLSSAFLRGFHAYANWLVGISWRRFIVLSVLLLVGAAILQSLPPFRWVVTEVIQDHPAPRSLPAPRPPPVAPAPPTPAPPAQPLPSIRIETPRSPDRPEAVDIQIDERGIRVVPRRAAPAASAASEASSAATAASAAGSDAAITIRLPESIQREVVREAMEEARAAIEESVRAQREAAEQAREAAEEARAALEEAGAAVERGPGGTIRRTRHVDWGDFLTDLSLLWILASGIIKATYKGRIQAEVKAAQATETAEAESLKRQVVEARMAAMQAQVEPHFLFNTLASIDHLIETDPPRASQMQKNLIALLRASMPTMREASGNGAGSGNGVRDLGRELAVIRPYLEILKVRMEERLATDIQVPDGLLSAEFPPMMIQTLVENAIKHGLEPKAEGGSLTVKAEVVHGKLAVSVADTGLGFGRAATAGTGVGLANIRERLQMLYGTRASLTVAENQPSGTRVTVTVPYKPVEGAGA